MSVDAIAAGDNFRRADRSEKDLAEYARIASLSTDVLIGERRASYERFFTALRELESVNPAGAIGEVVDALRTAAPTIGTEYAFDAFTSQGGPSGRLDEALYAEIARVVGDSTALVLCTATSFETVKLIRILDILRELGEGAGEPDGSKTQRGLDEVLLEALASNDPEFLSVRRRVGALAHFMFLGQTRPTIDCIVAHAAMMNGDPREMAQHERQRARIGRAERDSARRATLAEHPQLESTLKQMDAVLAFEAYWDPKKHQLRGHLNLSRLKGRLCDILVHRGAIETADPFRVTLWRLLDVWEGL